jgi:hypothetical protein
VSEDDDEDDRQSIAYSELPDNTSALVLSQPSGIPRIGSVSNVDKLQYLSNRIDFRVQK